LFSHNKVVLEFKDQNVDVRTNLILKPVGEEHAKKFEEILEVKKFIEIKNNILVFVSIQIVDEKLISNIIHLYSLMRRCRDVETKILAKLNQTIEQCNNIGNKTNV
jgi:hypothetical protein